MDVQYYLGIAEMQGYGTPAKDALWATCPETERLAILRHLLTFRAVTEICQFEEDLTVPEDQIPQALDDMVIKWSKKESLGQIPFTLAPFVFCAFYGTGFSFELLKREADRFLSLPERSQEDRPARPVSPQKTSPLRTFGPSKVHRL